VVLNILPQDQLDLILRRHAEILARLAGALEPAAFVALSRELAGIENVAKAIQDFRGQAEEAAGLEALLADPDAVQEVFANDVVIEVRSGATQLTFCSVQAVDSDANGKTTLRRVIRSRVALPIPVSDAMNEVYRQLKTAMAHHQATAVPPTAN
jgi:hypothetical protein